MGVDYVMGLAWTSGRVFIVWKLYRTQSFDGVQGYQRLGFLLKRDLATGTRDWGTPPLVMDRHAEIITFLVAPRPRLGYTLTTVSQRTRMDGQYASSVHAEGLSCFNI